MKLKKPKLNLKKLYAKQAGSDWQKSIYFIIILAALGFIVLLGYIYFSPENKKIIEQIDNEVSVDSIKIDTKTLEKIKLRIYPN